ncbi:MFS transporter [Sinorhizobium medicae]|uniref:MFS transporter n=1 Tax=Sinorhizobium medicae TaxID=110321 RepID=UPI00307FAE01
MNYSLAWALGWSAAASMVVAVLGLKLPVSNRSGSDLEPWGEFASPAVALDLKPRSGPILITTEYSISEENVDVFLDVMRERRHIQSRVGARLDTDARRSGDLPVDGLSPHAS